MQSADPESQRHMAEDLLVLDGHAPFKVPQLARG